MQDAAYLHDSRGTPGEADHTQASRCAPKRRVSSPQPYTMLFRQFDYYLLSPARFAAHEDSVLVGIAEDKAHLAELFDQDNATNARLRDERGLAPGIGSRTSIPRIELDT